MASKDNSRYIWTRVRYQGDSMWQLELYKYDIEPNVPWQYEAHRSLIFYIWDMVQKGAIKIQYVSTDEQGADVLTNPLSWVKFEYFHDKLGVVRKYFPDKEEQWWYYRLSSQGGMMKIWTLFEKEEQDKFMDSTWKGRRGQRYHPSSDK